MFRQKPNELFFKEAKKKNVGIIARVPLASGLLTGKFNKTTTFNKDDHRFFNRNGEAFDKGETFSGIDYHLGLQAVEELKKVFNRDENLVHKALQWILSFNEISCVIPGASSTEQLLANLNTLKARPISNQEKKNTKAIYDKYIKSEVHDLW
uniref:aldo/keto reductase n=1 Tax=Polaribacter sp. TaxID=1920175 RepID=UPI003F6D44C9